MNKNVDKPIIHLQDASPATIEKNFQNILNYVESKGSNLAGFKHIEFSAEKAETGLKVAHGLGYVPKDTVVTCLEGPGIPTFNVSKFDKEFIDVDTSDQVTVRLYVGTQQS